MTLLMPYLKRSKIEKKKREDSGEEGSIWSKTLWKDRKRGKRGPFLKSVDKVNRPRRSRFRLF